MKSPNQKDILQAAARHAPSGEFTVEQVVETLRAWNLRIYPGTTARCVEQTLGASGLYCTDENGTYVAI